MGFSCTNKDPETLAFMTRTAEEAREPILQFTMPLFAACDGKWMLWATGVLLQIGEKYFILTAAHVFDPLTGNPIPLNITDGLDGTPLLPIGEAILRRSPTKNRRDRLEDDHFDVCVCDIPTETARTLIAGKKFRFLQLSELDPWGIQDARSWYTVIGFPGVLNEKELAPNVLGSCACAYATFIYMGERGMDPLIEAIRGIHILLDYGPLTTRDDSGALVTPLPPFGMSGCGVWQIAKHGIDMANWSLTELKLVGIQSALIVAEQVLRATRIEHALGFIYRGHEHLQCEIERHFGESECRERLA